ncbi:hypothetical protein VB713_05925 [Anabaena cylindrica UHCC 0172]|nr:hypothetical protein [Anabaena cylindrica]MEA5550520.1 hypothetical protein [Anabaena cylindrica UHCC 0172]
MSLSSYFWEWYQMRDPQKNHIKIDPATLVLIASTLILIPLLLAGFLGQ